MTIRKVTPQPSAPRPAPKPSVPPPPKPSVTAVDPKVAAKTGKTSSFEAYRPPAVALDRRDPTAPSEGRGTNDDSVGEDGRYTRDREDDIGAPGVRPTGADSCGRGTNDDSVGRGTNDDSIGRGTNDDSIGRGTNDDSIGGVNGGRGPDDRGIGAEEVTQRGTALVPGREGLSPETSAKMDQLLSPQDPERAAQAQYVFESPAFKELSPADKAKIVNVMATGDIHCARAMAEMFEQSNGAMLLAKGSDGSTVLDNLDRLAASPDGQKIVGNLMYDLVNPGRIWQGRAPTCTVSTMQYELAHQDPGEYARLITGLALDGRVTMRGGGELVTNVAWDLYASDARRDERSKTEAIFQAACMEFANGSDTYLEYSQQSVGSDTYRGLRGEQISTMIGQLFGVKYETRAIGSDAEADNELAQILSRERPNRPVLFDITVDGQQSNHCVSLENVKNGRVYYRDPTSGELESMSVAEFRQRLVAVHYAPPANVFETVGSAVSSVVGKLKGFLHL